MALLCQPVSVHVVIVDINECAEYNGGCQHNCTNTNGSYSCTCRAGYKLTEDEHNCTEYSWCDKLPCPLITKVIAVFSMCILTGRQSTIILIIYIILPSLFRHYLFSCRHYQYYFCAIFQENKERNISSLC